MFDLSLEMLRVVEDAAIASARTMGMGNPTASDQAAVESMRRCLDTLAIQGQFTAAFTGVFGIKPSYGRVAAYPASPFSILAHVGPLTRTVTDAALMLTVIGGPDERDMMAWNTPVPDFRIGLNDGVRGLRVAWSPRLGCVQKLDREVEAATRKAANAARRGDGAGAEVLLRRLLGVLGCDVVPAAAAGV